MDTIPVVLIFDIEPDARVPHGRGPAACLGFEKLAGMVPALRDRLSTMSDAPAVLTWAVRIDPQIGELFGSPNWLAERYEREFDLFRASGDDFAIHPHSWRWQGRWISDDADAGWVAHCIDVGLTGFHEAFGQPCRLHKHGDRFMSTAVARQLDQAGVAVDLSVEPGLPATRGLSPVEESTGWIPNTITVPSHTYRPSRDDFRVPDPDRRDGLVMMPLTSGLSFARTPGDNRRIPTALAEPLTLWTDPGRFREQLRVRLASPALTHLAFAVRCDTALDADLWAFVEANEAEVGSQLRERHQWCGGLDGAPRALGRLGALDGLVEETPEQIDARARQWARGRWDLGFRERVDLEALDLDDGHPLLVEAVPAPPSVTTVLPVYAGRRHLREAVDSVVHQTQPPTELVVVNDGSSAEDLEFLHGLTAPFPIRIVHQSNAGQSAARNRGSQIATGELLAFLDQDDAWHPRHLAVLCQPFRDDPEVVWSYGDFDEIDAEGRDVTRSYLRQHGVAHPKSTLGACLERDLMVLPSASVVRRDVYDTLGGFDETLRGYEDEDLYVRAFRTGGRFAFHDEALTRYRVHLDGDSAGHGFAESRRRFSRKLRETVTDDRRSGRYYFRDLIAPRFFAASLDDYLRAVSARDWPASRLALRDLQHYGRLRRDRGAVAWKLAFVSNPRLFRQLLRLHDLLPASLRLTKNPSVRLR
jgi:glycosyltransferase involved in cell wall biosynthesis